MDGESEQTRNRRRNKLKRELYGEMGRREQRAVKSYKADMKELGEQFMRAESVEQMRNLSRMMMERRDSMLQKVGR